MALGHSFDMKIFDRNKVEFINQLTRFFVMEICSLILNVKMRTLKLLHGLTPSIATFLAASYFALCDTKFPLALTVETRVVDLPSVTEGSKVCQPNIYADLPIAWGQWMCGSIYNQNRIPPVRFFFDSTVSNNSINWPRKMQTHCADFRQVEFISGQPKPCLGIREGRIASTCAKTR
jgi:hypothetical protein